MKKQIAIVTEKEIVREVLKFYFLKKEYEVTTFESGSEFLSSEREPAVFTVIILDLNLPDITGIDLYDRLRSDNISAPIFFVSSRNISSELSRRIKNDPLIRYFQKPFDPEDVLMETGRLLNEKI